jgi:ribose transport system permease protein
MAGQISSEAGAAVLGRDVSPPPGEKQRGLLERVLRGAVTRWSPLLILIGLIVLFSIIAPHFATTRTWQSLAVTQAVVACVALGALMPLIVGEFDLSLGSMLGLVAMVGAYSAGHGAGAVECIVLMLAVGVLAGLVNGVITVVFGVSSFISTLATSIIMTGATLGLSNGEVLFKGIPPVITDIGQNKVAGLAICVWLALVVAVILHFVLQQTPTGRRMYATGASERVAFLAGVRTHKLKIAAFAGAGLLVAVGGIFNLGQAGGANPSTGAEFLLPAYGAAFLGVVSFRVGYYNVPGTVIAIVLLAVGFTGLSLLGVPSWVQPIFNGCVLLVAVLTARTEARRVRVG